MLNTHKTRVHSPSYQVVEPGCERGCVALESVLLTAVEEDEGVVK